VSVGPQSSDRNLPFYEERIPPFEEGERALLDHYEWLAGRIVAGAESDDGTDDR
jgi:hypothetical protein